MEQEIYVDILVFLNTVIDYFLLLITAAAAGREKKRGRLLAAALVGGLYALILLLPQLGGPLLTITRIAVAMVMTAVAFPFCSLRTFLFQCGLLYLAGFLFAGLMVAVWLVFSPPAMFYGNGVVYFHIPAATLVLAVLAAYGLVWLLSRRHQAETEEKQLARVQIGIGKGQQTLLGMVDTGNRLFDPFNGQPVVLCRYRSVKGILPAALLEYFERPGEERMERAAMQGIRFIPYEAVGKKGMLPVVRPAFLTIKQNGRYQQVEQVTAAIADQDFFESGYGILLHPGLKRLDWPEKCFQGKGDRYGKENQRKTGRFFGVDLGKKGIGFLHQRAGKSAGAIDQGGGSAGIPASSGRCESQGNADCPQSAAGGLHRPEI